MRIFSRRTALAGVGALAMVAAAAGTADAASHVTAPKPGNYTLYGCVSAGSRTLNHFYIKSSTFQNCPRGAFAVAFNSTGPRGATGAQGPSGTSGVVSVHTSDLGAVASVATGGSFVSNATQVGTIPLSAGTYLLNVNAKATPPSGGTGAVQVFPEFFVYNRAANASFSGDVLNVGSGALESGVNNQVDSYFSGSGVITVPKGETLHLYAFGYDSDRGSSHYALDDLSVTATQINPAQ
ncbi:MAG: hypothetical protein ACRDNZ_05065 [Streptosporangiaceae bacterium]